MVKDHTFALFNFWTLPLVDSFKGWFVWQVLGEVGNGLVGLLFNWLVG